MLPREKAIRFAETLGLFRRGIAIRMEVRPQSLRVLGGVGRVGGPVNSLLFN